MSTPAPSAAWTAQAERSNLRALRLMRWIALRLGRRVARWLLWPIAVYFLLFGGASARASRAYLRRALGRAPRWGERLAHVHRFAATVLDRVYLLRGDFHLFDVRLSGTEHLDAVLAQGAGAMLVGAHLGSFEALRALGQSRRGLRVAMLMYEDNARLINQTLRAIAPEAELHVIGLGRMDAMLQLRDWLDAGGVAGLLADRSLATGAGARAQQRRVDFFGQPVSWSDGPFRLAALLRRPVIFMAGLYHGGNRYELRFVPLADFSGTRPRGEAQEQRLQAAVQAYVRQLEALCREAPFNWFNFFDFWADAADTQASHHGTDSPAAGLARGPRPEPAGPGGRGHV